MTDDTPAETIETEQGDEMSEGETETAEGQQTDQTTDDLVVIGGGLAGYTAALSAARARPSASVRVVCGPVDRFRLETGLIDLLGYLPDESEGGDDGPVTNPISAIDRLPADHRYAQLGTETVQAALSLFDDVAGEQYRGAKAEQNALVPTATGHLAPAARYPESIAAGVASDRRPMRLVGFDAIADFDAELAAKRLDETLPYEITHSSVTTTLGIDEPPVARRFAATLDEDDGDTAQNALIEAIRQALDVEPRVGVPAVLGEASNKEVRTALADELTADIFEVPLGPPSVLGRRLESLLESALSETGVTIEQDVTLSRVETTDDRVDGIEDSNGQVYEGETFVLATGGLQTGGLVSKRNGISEPLFDCRVSAPDNRAAWTDRAFLGDHQAVRAGVETDEQLQPVTGSGEPQYVNLYASGRVLETTNVIAEHAASGLDLVTGYEAGRLAVE